MIRFPPSLYPHARLTFDLITEESASEGDTAEAGWLDIRGARRYATKDDTAGGAPLWGADAAEWQAEHAGELVIPLDDIDAADFDDFDAADFDAANSAKCAEELVDNLCTTHGVSVVEWSNEDTLILRDDGGFTDETDDGTPASLTIYVHLNNFTDDDLDALRASLGGVK